MKKILTTVLISIFSLFALAQTDTTNTDTVKIYFKDKVITIVLNKREKEIKEAMVDLNEDIEKFTKQIEQELEKISKLQDSLVFYDSLNLTTLRKRDSLLTAQLFADLKKQIQDLKEFQDSYEEFEPEEFNAKLEKMLDSLFKIQDSLFKQKFIYYSFDTTINNKLDSIRFKINISKKIITGLNQGLGDMKNSLEDLQDELEDLQEEKEAIYSLEPKQPKFKPHSPFFFFGVSSFTYDFSTPSPENYLKQEYEKSITLGFNIIKNKVQFWKKGGLMIGAGIKWRSYDLYDNINFWHNDSLSLEPIENLVKNKIKTFSITVPILFEVQLSKKHRYPFFQIGVNAELPLKKYYKLVYYENSRKIKENIDVGKIINPFFAEATFTFGLKDIEFIFSYDLLPFFQKPINRYNPIFIGIGIGI